MLRDPGSARDAVPVAAITPMYFNPDPVLKSTTLSYSRKNPCDRSLL